jgi:hypothetical protein
MKTWKLSIKPDSEPRYNAFERCREKSLIGIGWHHAFVERHPSNLEEAATLVQEKWQKSPHAVKRLTRQMQPGDHVWNSAFGRSNVHLAVCRGILFSSRNTLVAPP